MADFTPDIADDVLATIRDGNEAVAGAFSRALDGEFIVTVADAIPIVTETQPDEWQGPGLVLAFAVGDAGALLFLPEASGLLPDWCAAPDATGQSKLETLAHELGIVLLPEAFTASESKHAHVARLGDAFQSCEPADSTTLVPLTLQRGTQTGIAHLVWPVRDALAVPGADLSSLSTDAPPQPATATAATDPIRQPTRQRIQYADLDDGIRQLPNYAKSLLKVEVPVTVTLSTTHQSVEEILQLGPGSILKFDKRCEDNLELEIGGQTVAEGEAVKVGDKFGLWITAMTIPGERFWAVNGERSGSRVQ